MTRVLSILLLTAGIAGCQPADPSPEKLKADISDAVDQDFIPYVDLSVKPIEFRRVAEDRLEVAVELTMVRNAAQPPPGDLPLLRSFAQTEMATARFGGSTRDGRLAVLALSPQGTKNKNEGTIHYLLRDGQWVPKGKVQP